MTASHGNVCKRLTLILVLLSFLLSRSCAFHSLPSDPEGRPFTEAEVLFHRDPRWLGADGALSVPLAKGRTLWMFGDTFIATSNAHRRLESEIVRNTVAIQSGMDPRTASITFHWRYDSDGSPASFFPDNEESWYWPGHGIRLNQGPLVIFLYVIVKRSGQDFGFANAGYGIALIDKPDASPDSWNPRIVAAPPSEFDAVPAAALVEDGAHIIAVAIRRQGAHAGALVRYTKEQLAQGDLSHAEWWTGENRGWVPGSALGADGPLFVLDDAGSECSVHWSDRWSSYMHIASYGFGASTIGMRTAPELTGPWSSPALIYRPTESSGPRPFVYAAKAHPELVGPSPADLVITYVTSSFEFEDLLTPAGESSLYRPRFVALQIGGWMSLVRKPPSCSVSPGRYTATSSKRMHSRMEPATFSIFP